MARVTMMMTVRLNEKLSVFLKEYDNLPLVYMKQLCTYLSLHKTRYLSRAMLVMVKALQLKAQAHTNHQKGPVDPMKYNIAVIR